MDAVPLVAGFVVLAIGIAVAVRATVRLRATRRELDDVRRARETGSTRVVAAYAAAGRYGEALDIAPVGVVVVDAAGATVLANAAVQPFLGGRHADVVAAARMRELLDAARLQRREADEPLELFGPPRRYLRLLAAPLSTGAVAFVIDTTSEHQVAAVRRDFVANVSHELKTPVGALAVLSETLAASADDQRTVGRLAPRIHQEAQRLAVLVTDLLDLSRLERDGPDLDRVRATDVLADAAARIATSAEVAGVDVVVHEPEAGLQLVADRRQLVTAVANLLDNAVQYSNPPAKVEAGAERAGPDHVEFWVQDYGLGIPSAHLDRIFERFYRVDRARTRKTGGTGLGLAIVRRVAACHGGEVLVRSREGEGSRFTLRLAVAPTIEQTGEL